jgi:quercetin dioxygenase-like cupin family protein
MEVLIMDLSRIHITPDNVLADLDEIAEGTEPRSRCKIYIRAGQFGLNEVNEANYYVGNRVFSHEHRSGYETFLVDNGTMEFLSLSKKAPLHKGDMVHITPFTPHSIHCLEDNSIWRAFLQGLWLLQFIEEDRAFRDRHWDTFFSPEFKAANAARDKSAWFDYQIPECRDVSPEQIPAIRTYEFALAEYSYEGITLKLKVGRWETAGLKEVWQFRLSGGYKLSWDETHPFPHLYDVFSGSVRVRLEGMEPFTAKTRDLLHIPKYLGGSIETLEDTVLLDTGCQGFLTRFMDEMNVYKQKTPQKLKDRAFVKEIMLKNDYHVLFGSF